jgi:DNA-binding HxlR family transcriptional regulator
MSGWREGGRFLLDRRHRGTVWKINYRKHSIHSEGRTVALIFQHFCSVARAVEKVGEKWSLLIVRDLLRGPQRFTDLLNLMSNITPAWLTRRLRELEASGIVARDHQPGRREVWYRLTTAGRDLEPVIEALFVWGMRHAMRPPRPGEAVHPELLMNGSAAAFNRLHRRLPRPARWSLRFPMVAYTLAFDEGCWSQCRGEEPDADLIITTTPEKWAAFLTVRRAERGGLLREMQIRGGPERIAELMGLFGIPGPDDRPRGEAGAVSRVEGGADRGDGALRA